MALVHDNFLAHWRVKSDCLVVGDRPLTELVEQVGRTPFYAYDRRLLKERIASLRHHLPETVDVHYALKANPMPDLVRYMLPLVDGCDVASAGELELALEAGANPSHVSMAGPGKSEAELFRAATAQILINVESFRDIAILGRIAEETGHVARVAVRVNPDFDVKSSGAKMGGGATQFGIDSEQVPEALDKIRRANLHFEGFHVFNGSQNLEADAICSGHWKALDLVLSLASSAPGPVRSLNIGGGFGIPYFPRDRPLDIGRIGEHLHEFVRAIENQLPEARLIVELGRYLVGEAGVYVCRIIDRKISRGRVFLITDGGLHHHLAASGNFGQVVRKNFPVIIGNRIAGGRRETATVVGPLCTPLDLLADRMDLAEAHEGDLVVVFQSGAYGLTASPTAFLSHPPPLEILV